VDSSNRSRSSSHAEAPSTLSPRLGERRPSALRSAVQRSASRARAARARGVSTKTAHAIESTNPTRKNSRPSPPRRPREALRLRRRPRTRLELEEPPERPLAQQQVPCAWMLRAALPISLDERALAYPTVHRAARATSWLRLTSRLPARCISAPFVTSVPRDRALRPSALAHSSASVRPAAALLSLERLSVRRQSGAAPDRLLVAAIDAARSALRSRRSLRGEGPSGWESDPNAPSDAFEWSRSRPPPDAPKRPGT
jgi:hypothetical protein